MNCKFLVSTMFILYNLTVGIRNCLKNAGFRAAAHFNAVNHIVKSCFDLRQYLSSSPLRFNAKIRKMSYFFGKTLVIGKKILYNKRYDIFKTEFFMDDKLFELLTHAIVMFTALPVHECAHAWSAYKMGDDTAKKEGRISLNPFRHLSLWGCVMMLAVGFGWGKPVNVNPNNFKNPKKGMMLSSLAGPASNFIMAYLAMVVCRFALYRKSEIFFMLFLYISRINLSLGVFNFLPIPPLDGSKIFNAVLPEKIYFTIMRYEQYIFIGLIVLIYAGVLDKPLAFLNNEAYIVMVYLTDWVDALMGMVVRS